MNRESGPSIQFNTKNPEQRGTHILSSDEFAKELHVAAELSAQDRDKLYDAYKKLFDGKENDAARKIIAEIAGRLETADRRRDDIPAPREGAAPTYMGLDHAINKLIR